MVNVYLQLFLFASVTGMCQQEPEEVYVKAGEMVVLVCPNKSKTPVIWTVHSLQQVRVISDMSPDEQEQLGLLSHGKSLVIFSATANLQGNYSCSVLKDTSQYWLVMMYTTPSTEIIKRLMYSEEAHVKESHTMKCCDVTIPDQSAMNISSLSDIMWRKEGELLENRGYFSSVEEKDRGNYTCTRAYLHNGLVYNMTFTIELKVHPKVPSKTPVITSPNDNDVFEVDLGTTVVITCKAALSDVFDSIFWMSGLFGNETFVGKIDSFPVYFNYTRQGDKAAASLVFKNVSEEDLSRRYSCKLESPRKSMLVTISLVKRARPSYVSLLVTIVCIVVVVSLTVVVSVRFKIPLTLFVRDTLGCRVHSSDGKSYDAFLLHYNSDTDAGLTDCDRNWLESVLETSYGYSLCLWERDVLPGGAEVDAVLDCIERSRTVVLVPTSSDSDPGSGLLSGIHAALVEHQSHLVFIKTETTKTSTSGVLPEALQHLVEAGDCVTWKGISSMTTSSSFLKQLRYYLPAPQHPPKLRPQKMHFLANPSITSE